MKQNIKINTALLLSLMLVGGSASWAADSADMAPPPPAMVKAGDKGAVVPMAKDGKSMAIAMDAPAPTTMMMDEPIEKPRYNASGRSLAELNDMRQEIAVLDVKIDLEKRKAELANIQNSGRSIAPMIPASALLPPPMPAMPMAPPPPPPVRASDISVLRITGADGRYEAYVSVNGNNRIVRVGDKLSDGGFVSSIDSRGVEIQGKNKKREVITIKDVTMAFTNR